MICAFLGSEIARNRKTIPEVLLWNPYLCCDLGHPVARLRQEHLCEQRHYDDALAGASASR
jgi:hypothetical protein